MNDSQKTRVTLKDIARVSGYTVNTVSHALRGKSDISAATRAKIVQIAQDMGYVGNTLASSLRSGRSNTVAVIVSDVINPHFGNVVHTIESRLREAGYSTIILCTNDDPERECGAVRTALSHLADGVLICPSQYSFKPIAMLRQSNLPYVIIGRQFADAPDNCALCDDEGGGRLLTEYLLSLGHRRILYVGGDAHFSSETERRAGYRAAMAGAGERLEMSFEAYTELERKGRLADIMSIYRPTAIFAFRDAMAWTIINQCRRAGILVPQDVSVAGFDYVAEQLSFLPPLTTVASATQSYATVAAKRLLELMAGETPPPRVIRLGMTLIDKDATVRPLSRQA